jgi:hypothetical protein
MSFGLSPLSILIYLALAERLILHYTSSIQRASRKNSMGLVMVWLSLLCYSVFLARRDNAWRPWREPTNHSISLMPHVMPLQPTEIVDATLHMH